MANYKAQRHKTIGILPNAFTTGNLFAGFFSIMQSFSHRYDLAAIALFIGMLLDALDGRVARMTKTQSAFGEQYDSMCDMVTFGVAPALLAYHYGLYELGRLGWFACFVYIACAAMRLARFNTNIMIVDSRFFQGLPSPSAAAMIGGFIWLSVDERIPLYECKTWLLFGIVLYAGLTMVSNAPFVSGKKMIWQRKLSPQFWGVLTVVIVGAVLINPSVMLFVLFLAYAFSGWGVLYYRWYKIRQRKKKML